MLTCKCCDIPPSLNGTLDLYGFQMFSGSLNMKIKVHDRIATAVYTVQLGFALVSCQLSDIRLYQHTPIATQSDFK